MAADTPTPQGSDTPALPEPVALLTVTGKDNPTWGGMNFIGLTEHGEALPAGRYELHTDNTMRALMAERDAAREERDALRREVEARKPLTDDDWQAIADDCDRIIPAVIKQAVMRRLAPPSADGGDRG
jgi:hypothetical protein